jgi:hypothetical protein
MRTRPRPLLALVLALACGPRAQLFMDREHRENFALQAAELEKVQFYVSEQIVAHELGVSGEPIGPGQVFVVEGGTAGVVTAAGPHWLRVSFGPGPGVFFVADPAVRPDALYLLGTQPPGGSPPVQLLQDGERLLYLGDRRFRVIYGATARLMIDDGDLEDLIRARPHIRGRAAGG